MCVWVPVWEQGHGDVVVLLCGCEVWLCQSAQIVVCNEQGQVKTCQASASSVVAHATVVCVKSSQIAMCITIISSAHILSIVHGLHERDFHNCFFWPKPIDELDIDATWFQLEDKTHQHMW